MKQDTISVIKWEWCLKIHRTRQDMKLKTINEKPLDTPWACETKTVIAPLTTDKLISSIKLTLITNENWGRACMCVMHAHTKETTWYGLAMCNKDGDYTIH